MREGATGDGSAGGKGFGQGQKLAHPERFELPACGFEVSKNVQFLPCFFKYTQIKSILGHPVSQDGLSLLPLSLVEFQFPAPGTDWSATHRLNYVRLKFQELLLVLHANAACTCFKPSAGYPQEKVERIQSVHGYLTEHLAEHLTVKELSRRFFINMDDLKKGFKLVYGMPIAQYMRSYRIKKAAEMLCRTTLRVQEIAACVGYDHPGKFALAFRERMQISPSAYRKTQGT